MKKYGVAGKVATDAVTSLIDYKEGQLRSALPINNGYFNSKNGTDVLVDFGYCMSKTIAKEAYKVKDERINEITGHTIDYIAGAHKPVLKQAIKKANE